MPIFVNHLEIAFTPAVCFSAFALPAFYAILVSYKSGVR